MIKRETIVAGRTVFRRIFGTFDSKISGGKRKKKNKPTPESVKEINRKNSERELHILMNHNFNPGDLHITLTYKGNEPSKTRAQKDLRSFIDRLKRFYKRKNQIFKWIVVTEYEHKRIHHHMILPYIDTAELTELWGHGFVKVVHLDISGDYRKLASYLIKETDKTFRDANAVSRQRYRRSKNVIKPDVKVEEVSVKELVRDPKPIKGYAIDEDSIYKGVNPVTNVPYMEYVMISTTPTPRLSIWPRGRRKKYKEKYYDKLLREISEYQTRFIFDEEDEY